MISLPIDPHLAEVTDAVRRTGAAVVVAPPGSGKTTRVPPALAAALGGRVLVTQPRRVAARLAARRMADERNEPLGRTVGFSTRFERKTSAATTVELLTEGLLVRRLQADPFLEGVSCVVLDEFHERTAQVDLALALLTDCRRSARDDLAVVVMSATLDPGPVATHLHASVVHAPGRTFPIDIAYARPSVARLEDRTARAVRRVLAEESEGHVLVFLPGVAEIERTRRKLNDVDADVFVLHGRLPAAEQNAALAPSRRRKVVLSTNLAETSVTLEGARAVVDTGLARVARFDPAVGLTRLDTRSISRASADQRAGRAGRTGPGRCLRLWSETEHQGRRAADIPELLRADLASLVLTVLDWGTPPEDLPWLDAPPEPALADARARLTALGALKDGNLTKRGRALAALPVDPPLGAVLLEGRARGVEASAATFVALQDADPFPGTPNAPGLGDLEPRLAALAELDWTGRPPPRVNRSRLRECLRVRDQLLKQVARLPVSPAAESPFDPLTAALVAGLPGRLGRRRGPGSPRYLLASGHGAMLDERSGGDGEFLFAVDLRSARRGERAEHRIRLAHPVEFDATDIPPRDELRFDAGTESVVLRRVTRIGTLVLRDVQSSARPSPSAITPVLLAAAREAGVPRPSEEDERTLARVAFASRLAPDAFEAAPATWNELLPTLCEGRRSFAELRKADLSAALVGALPWAARAALDRLAPERIRVPSGSSLRVDYRPDPPVLAARIQQMFGTRTTPTVGDGRVPVVLHLLAPNNRPAQVTRDLAGFWAGSYQDVRKDLRGRYPKHPWPEDPASAEATNRAKRRR